MVETEEEEEKERFRRPDVCGTKKKMFFFRNAAGLYILQFLSITFTDNIIAENLR